MYSGARIRWISPVSARATEAIRLEARSFMKILPSRLTRGLTLSSRDQASVRTGLEIFSCAATLAEGPAAMVRARADPLQVSR
jgi:hypothetical protein